MSRRLRTHQKITRVPTPELSTAPAQGMFQPRPFGTPASTVDADQQPDLKISLMQAERYGHHLSQMHDTDVSVPQVIQPKIGMGRFMQSEPAVQLSSQRVQPSSGGRPLPKNVQQKMEAAFSTDFSKVSVHEGTQAKLIGADAYAQGNQIHFQPGKYNPTSQPGQQLLGHELTHVVQQRAGQVAVPQGKGTPINSDPKLEQEADILGAKAAQGEQVQVAGAGSGLQRQATSQLGHNSTPVQLSGRGGGRRRPSRSPAGSARRPLWRPPGSTASSNRPAPRRPAGPASSQAPAGRSSAPRPRPAGHPSNQPSRIPAPDGRPASDLRPLPSGPASDQPSRIPPPPTAGQQRASRIPSEERAKRKDFVAARAHLAAGLRGAPAGNPETPVTGASTRHPEEKNLQTEVDSSTKKVNSWGQRNKSPKVNDEGAQSIYKDTLQNDYSELTRFQDEPEHNKPRKKPIVTSAYKSPATGLEHHRELHKGEEYQSEMQATKAHEGAGHTIGMTHTDFVSLTNNPQKLKESADTAPGGAREIANKAKEMHTYQVPKQYTWNSEKMSNMVERKNEKGELKNPHLSNLAGKNTKQHLQDVPEKEGEELYLGNDLDKYRTKRKVNPNLPEESKE